MVGISYGMGRPGGEAIPYNGRVILFIAVYALSDGRASVRMKLTTSQR